VLRERTNAFALGTRSLESEVVLDDVPVEGDFPDWLQGSLIRNGPARFEANGTSLRHWFDGMAMLHRFTFGGGRVSYANRFLRTKAFEATEEGQIGYREFATDPCRELFKRVASVFDQRITDNTVVNVVRSGEEFMALTETPMPVIFDPRTLATLGYAERAPGHMSTAHPHFDPESGELVNFAIQLGPRNTYKLYRREPGGERPRPFATVPAKAARYLHSFALTQRFAVLALGPFELNPLGLALGSKPLIDNYKWRPEKGGELVAVDRRSGEVAARWDIEPFFVLHNINAFDDGDDVVVDLCAFEDASIVRELMLERMRGTDTLPLAHPRRYRAPLGGGEVTVEQLAGEELELPRIHPKLNTRPYSIAWGISRVGEGAFNAIGRLDLERREVERWHEPDRYPGEPVFVPRPGGTAEDDGVLLSLVLDAAEETSFLLALDAATLDELARARLPHHVPFGFHGHFFGDV
jgi:beta,beta-carotene 9',10'-dioxygenase